MPKGTGRKEEVPPRKRKSTNLRSLCLPCKELGLGLITRPRPYLLHNPARHITHQSNNHQLASPHIRFCCNAAAARSTWIFCIMSSDRSSLSVPIPKYFYAILAPLLPTHNICVFWMQELAQTLWSDK